MQQQSKQKTRQQLPHQLQHYHLSQFVVEQAAEVRTHCEQLESKVSELRPQEGNTSVAHTPCYQVVSKHGKQERLAFLDMCRGDSDGAPFTVWEQSGGTNGQTLVTSQSLRHLALIDLEGLSYRQLPLSNASLCGLIRRHAERRTHSYETQYEFIEEAKRRLREYAECPADVYASLRFLGLAQKKSVEQIHIEKVNR